MCIVYVENKNDLRNKRETKRRLYYYYHFLSLIFTNVIMWGIISKPLHTKYITQRKKVSCFLKPLYIIGFEFKSISIRKMGVCFSRIKIFVKSLDSKL